MKLMCKVQDYANQYELYKIKRHMFSGNWMEKLDELAELMASVCQDGSYETALIYDENTRVDPITDSKIQTFKNKPGEEMVDSQALQDLKTLLKTTEQKLEDAVKENEALKLTIDEREEIIEQLRDKLGDQDSQREEEFKKQQDMIKRLNSELQKTQKQLEDSKNQLKSNKQEYEKLVADIPEVKELEAIRRAMEANEKQRQLDVQRDKALRFRAGILFQQAIENVEKDKVSAPAPEPKKKDIVKSGDYYLTDDAALIRFLNVVERNQPPSLYQRLLDADVEKTMNLKKSQFTGILIDLKLTPQGIMSLQRIAGFTSGRKALEIDEFIKIIKERGKIRQEVENDTFRKIQKAIRKEGWSLEEAFEAFDIDKNKFIDYQEMVDGFKKLKIHVPNKHLKSVFAILDEDGNGSISLPEFKGKLEAYAKTTPAIEFEPEGESEFEGDEDYYRRKEEEKKAKEEQEKQLSLIKEKEIQGYKEDLQKGKLVDQNDVIKRKQQEAIKTKVTEESKREYQRQLISGELKVQVGKGQELTDFRAQGYKYFYLVLSLKGANEDEPFRSNPITYYEKQNFEWAAKIPMINSHPDEFDEEFNVKFYVSKGEFENSDFVGEIFCKWKVALDRPNQYAITNRYPL